MYFVPPQKIAACTLFLHFMVKSFEKVQFCVFAKQSSEKIFFQFWKFPEILYCPYFSFQNVSIENTSHPISPSIFFLMWTSLWTLSCEKKKLARTGMSNHLRKVSSNRCFQCFAPKKKDFTPPEKKWCCCFFPFTKRFLIFISQRLHG